MREHYKTEIFTIGFNGEVLDPPETFQRWMSPEFTEDEKDHIKTILNGYDPQKVIEFIDKIEPICAMKFESIKWNDAIESKENSIRLLKMMTNMHAEIERLVDNDTINMSYADDMRRFNYSISDGAVSLEYKESPARVLGQEILDRCSIVRDELSEILNKITELREMSLKSGRSAANKDGFYSQMTRLYSLLIDKSTTTRTGVFSEIIGVINTAVGLPGECPERAIRQAIQEDKTK